MAIYTVTESKMWINAKDKLPPEGKYVIAMLNKHNWIDDTDQDHVYTTVVKLVRGISKKERSDMKDGLIESYDVALEEWCFKTNQLVKGKCPRWKIERSEDEASNNLVPYYWTGFCGSFFGQEVAWWMPIPPLEVSNVEK